MSQLSQTNLWHIPELGNLELLRAHHQKQAFPRHTHERYAIGVIEQGALGFYYRGENVVASRGDISLCIPGEVHTGQAATPEGWTYRMFYFDVPFLEHMTADLTDGPRCLPFFQSGVIEDTLVAEQLRALHLRLEKADTPKLEKETALLDVLGQLIERHADTAPLTLQTGREAQAVIQVRRYLERHYAEDISLRDLAHLTRLSRYYLVRVFKASVGVPPHTYLRQVRVRHAKAMLAQGHSVAQVAMASGFTDQSHLTRWFKRLWGFTPGQYRNSVQDNEA